jgi:hypothetical protein
MTPKVSMTLNHNLAISRTSDPYSARVLPWTRWAQMGKPQGRYVFAWKYGRSLAPSSHQLVILDVHECKLLHVGIRTIV